MTKFSTSGESELSSRHLEADGNRLRRVEETRSHEAEGEYSIFQQQKHVFMSLQVLAHSNSS